MGERIAHKTSQFGYVEVVMRSSDCWYLLYVGGVLKAQSASLSYIMGEFDKLR